MLSSFQSRGLLLFVSFLCSGLSGYVAGGNAQTRSAPPNFVFLLADDLGYGDVRYNGGFADTPNLDAMAAANSSIQLLRYYSGGPVCSPTRGTILTGRNHNRYCVWTANAGNKCDDFQCPETMPLPTSEITAAEILKKQGYRTAMFGKWHLGDLKPLPHGNKKWPQSSPGMHGFDSWWVTERSAATSDINCACFNTTLCPLGHYQEPPPCNNYYSRDPLTGLLETFAQPIIGDDSHFLLKEFSNFLAEVVKTEEPFFVYLPFHAVHIPYLASLGHIETYTARGYTLQEIDYLGAISAMDDVVGQVRELLKQYDVSNNTMLWFTSDNGPAPDAPIEPGVTAGFRGRKTEIFEGGIRVPGIIEWPALIQKNRNTSYPVVSSDFLPTVCDILGIDPPTDRPIDGTSIMPMIRGKSTTRNKSIAWAFHIPSDFNASYAAAMSDDQYKVYANYDSGSVKSAYFFNLTVDPFETQDISSLHQDMVESYLKELEAWRQSVIHSAVDVVQCYGTD